ncbi:putative (DUF1639)-RELATED [Salix viminalis]|uniref:(DUF1639)-RELATED n=1 Tax=Salix viminalis TaxID=40686 RepID=A0A9Q0ZD58_SALVM|nr:putative (DUF1639)-RELATED [Salix viminalis]
METAGLKVETLSKQKSDDAETLEKKSKIFIRLRTNKNCSGSSSSKCMVDDVAADAGDLDSAAVVEDVEESMPKTWNLRPRRAVNKGLNGSGGTVKIGGGAVQEIKSQVPSSDRNEMTRSNRNGNDANNYDNNNKEKEKVKEKEKEKKLRFSIPLTREEIEEDIYSLTGSKPARSACFLVCGCLQSPRNVTRFMKLLQRSDSVDTSECFSVLLYPFHFLVAESVNQCNRKRS